jgi:hypothetical protein
MTPGYGNSWIASSLIESLEPVYVKYQASQIQLVVLRCNACTLHSGVVA